MLLKIGIHALPVLTLFLLSPILAEIVVGSIPATRLTDFMPAIGLYGSGALLIRETALRFNLRWFSILALGLAFGIVEEAIALQSTFRTDFFGLDLSFGRAFGVNWVWALFIVFYHGLFSIAIPIRITEIIFYDKREVRWIPHAILMLVALLYFFMVIYYFRLFLRLTSFKATTWHFLGSIAVTAIAILAAMRFPKKHGKDSSDLAKRWRITLAAALTLIWFSLFTTIFIENTWMHPALIIVSGLVVMVRLLMLLNSSQMNEMPVPFLKMLIACIVIQCMYGILVLSESQNIIDRFTQIFVSMLALTGLFLLKRKIQTQPLS